MTKEEIRGEEKVIRELKELLLNVLVDDLGHTILVSYAQSKSPNERLKTTTYRISTTKGSFSITHSATYAPCEDKIKTIGA